MTPRDTQNKKESNVTTVFTAPNATIYTDGKRFVVVSNAGGKHFFNTKAKAVKFTRTV